VSASNAPREIAVFSQFYEPEPCAASNRVASLARSLARCGHRVTVLTGMPSFPKGTIDPAYAGMKRCVEYDGTIRVVRRLARVGYKGIGGRLLNWLSLAGGLAWAAAFELEPADTVVVSSPPITMAIPALLAAWRHRAKLVVDVRDVFPDMGLRLGVWNARSPIVRALGAFVRFLYNQAAIVVAVTPSARESILSRGVAPERVILAPNGFEFSHAIPPRPERSALKVFEVAYAGNMGLATGLDVILDAAKLLRDDPSIRFVLAGGGLDAQRLVARIEEERLANVSFLGVLSRDESLKLLARADATIVPLHRDLIDAIPSKMFDALAVGCPMILSARGEAQRLLARTQTGIPVEPNDPKALADGVLACRAQSEVLERRSHIGRAFVREHFDRERIMGSLAARIGAIA
jgi:glycosyltransferase involved in cell wall biosynthesis